MTTPEHARFVVALPRYLAEDQASSVAEAIFLALLFTGFVKK